LLLQIHDEIALSVKNKEEAREAANIMCNAVKLEILSKVDIDTGQTWGDSL
jgi:DNA polymerase I-like protein with 3'-5' exonuclease and polymerase domains